MKHWIKGRKNALTPEQLLLQCLHGGVLRVLVRPGAVGRTGGRRRGVLSRGCGGRGCVPRGRSWCRRLWNGFWGYRRWSWAARGEHAVLEGVFRFLLIKANVILQGTVLVSSQNMKDSLCTLNWLINGISDTNLISNLGKNIKYRTNMPGLLFFFQIIKLYDIKYSEVLRLLITNTKFEFRKKLNSDPTYWAVFSVL